MIKILLLLLFNNLISQDLITNPTELYLFKKEIQSLESNRIEEELFISPFIRKSPSKYNYYNIIENIISDNKFVIEPIVSVRFSNSGFEVSNVNSSVSSILSNVE